MVTKYYTVNYVVNFYQEVTTMQKTIKEIGIINEIGDLGLGFMPLNEQDTKALEKEESNKKDNKNKK